MIKDPLTHLLGVRDGLLHALMKISALRNAITVPAGTYLPPKRHSRKRATAEMRIAELDKAIAAVDRELTAIKEAIANIQGGHMTPARVAAFKALWPATTRRPLRAHARGPRKATLDAMKDDGHARVINGGYVLTAKGHAAANELRVNGWST